MKYFLGVDFFICYNLFMSLATYILRITYTVVCLVLKARFVVLLAECDFSAARSRSTLVFCSTQVLAESDSDARERCDCRRRVSTIRLSTVDQTATLAYHHARRTLRAYITH